SAIQQQQLIDASNANGISSAAALAGANGDIAIANEVQVYPSSSTATGTLPTALTRPRRKLDTGAGGNAAGASAIGSNGNASALPPSNVRGTNGATTATATAVIPRMGDA